MRPKTLCALATITTSLLLPGCSAGNQPALPWGLADKEKVPYCAAPDLDKSSKIGGDWKLTEPVEWGASCSKTHGLGVRSNQGICFVVGHYGISGAADWYRLEFTNEGGNIGSWYITGFAPTNRIRIQCMYRDEAAAAPRRVARPR